MQEFKQVSEVVLTLLLCVWLVDLAEDVDEYVTALIYGLLLQGLVEEELLDDSYGVCAELSEAEG